MRAVVPARQGRVSRIGGHLRYLSERLVTVPLPLPSREGMTTAAEFFVSLLIKRFAESKEAKSKSQQDSAAATVATHFN